jgi:ABC-type multidrug transport system fused ATPase/permease subunit
VVFTTSPLLLDHTDQVFMITEGRVAAVGNHFELLKKNEIYKELVVRGE